MSEKVEAADKNGGKAPEPSNKDTTAPDLTPKKIVKTESKEV